GGERRGCDGAGTETEVHARPALSDGGYEPLAVRSGAEMGNRAIPAISERMRRLRSGTPDNNVKAVGLEARALLRDPSQISIGEEYRLSVPSRVVRGQVDRRSAAVGRDLEQIEVG